MRKISVVLLLAALVSVTGCKKDTTNPEGDLMLGAVEYTGEYPSPDVVSYTDNGSTIQVDAYPGQFLAYFRNGVSDEDAQQVISSSGGEVLGKIPAIGFYHINVDVASVNAFINSMHNSTSVFAVKPNTVSYPKSGAIVLDACNAPHGVAVKEVLRNCGGSLDRCSYVPIDRPTGVPTSMLIYATTGFVNINNGGPTLINMSFSPGLVNKDWELASYADGTKAIEDWNSNMYFLLNGIANIPAAKRKNLVITFAAGNENMPIGDILNSLRGLSSDNGVPFADILKNNFLIVTTDSILSNGLKANRADLSDPDVVIMNNTSAHGGTSLAAPCAMGFLDSVMRAKGISASEALKAIKDASWLLPNREVKFSNISNSIGATVYYAKGPFTVTGRIDYPNQTYRVSKHVFGEVRIHYNPQYNIHRITFSDCYDLLTHQPGISDSYIAEECLNFNSNMLDTEGVLTYDPYTTPNYYGLVFKGLKSTFGNQITGDFWVKFDSSHKVPVVLTKQ